MRGMGLSRVAILKGKRKEPLIPKAWSQHEGSRSSLQGKKRAAVLPVGGGKKKVRGQGEMARRFNGERGCPARTKRGRRGGTSDARDRGRTLRIRSLRGKGWKGECIVRLMPARGKKEGGYDRAKGRGLAKEGGVLASRKKKKKKKHTGGDPLMAEEGGPWNESERGGGNRKQLKIYLRGAKVRAHGLGAET